MKKLALTIAAFSLALFAQPDREARSGPADEFAMQVEFCNSAHASGKPDKCKLYGKIKIVDSFPDVKIKKVDSFPDIKVKWVDSFPDKPGKWKKVDSFPDFKVQFVDSFPDYKIKEVTSFPGCD